MARFFPLLLSLILLAGCDQLTGSSGGSSSPGDGKPVDAGALSENGLPSRPIRFIGGTAPIPAQEPRTNWPQTGGSASHTPGHSPFRLQADLAWDFSASGKMRRGRLTTSEPLVYNNRAYILSWDLTVSAVSMINGHVFWQRSVMPEGERDGVFGGGMAIVGDTLFVTTGAGHIHALNLINGDTIWSQPLNGPSHAGPLVHLGQLYVTSIFGSIDAFTLGGAKLWTHETDGSLTRIIGPTKAAGAGNSIFALDPSGVLNALLPDGQVAWEIDLAVQGSTGRLNDRISDARALPVVRGDMVIASSWSDRTLAIDAPSGTKMWEVPLGGASTPLVTADTVFLVSKNGSLSALRRSDGAQIWETKMTRQVENDRIPNVAYYGPLMAGGYLLVGSSEGYVQFYHIDTGAFMREINVGSPLVTDMALAQETLIVTSQDGRIRAYR